MKHLELSALTEALATRFWKKVNKGETCWLWTASLMGTGGYGAFRYGGRQVGAHRIAYALTYGDPGDRLVCHSCDIRICVRPDHLFLGTHTENARDMRDKGRAARQSGTMNGWAKLTDAHVAAIRERLTSGEIGLHLAREFGVSNATISLIRHRKRWTHVP